MKHLGYIQLILIVLFIMLGWQVINRMLPKDDSFSFLDTALQSAGNNRQELEKVLHYYRINLSDSLKYKAACFLIENIPFYTYSDGEQLENYKSYYTWLKKSKGKTPQQVVDSIKKIYGPMKEPSKKRDIMETQNKVR